MLAVAPHVNAKEMKTFLWDNQFGAQEISNCELQTLDKHTFHITDVSKKDKDAHTENLRNIKNVLQSHLIKGSIVRDVSGNEKRNYGHIKVIGVNKIDGVTTNKWHSKREDEGYLYHRSIKPIEDYLIKVENHPNINFLHAISKNGYETVKCGERSYYLFKNYKSLNSSEPDNIIAINENETELLKEIRTIELESIDNANFTKDTLLQEEETISDKMIISIEQHTNDAIEDILNFDPTLSTTSSSSQGATKNEETATQNKEEQPKAPSKSEEMVICLEREDINIRNEDLDEVLFKAKKGEVVQIFQSFEGDDVKTKTVNGTEYEFVKVKFSQREEADQKVGRVAKKFVREKSQCKYLKAEVPAKLAERPLKTSGIDDEKCCEFPTIKKVTHDFTSGMRKFGARRGGGTRTHAACDLYRLKDEPAISIAPGKVRRDLYFFYQGTYAIEITHDGGTVVRYGELTGKKADGIRQGGDVAMGQRVGYIGVVNSNCCLPMLHFEMYKGTAKGELSTKGNKYQRRSDLMDPTYYLLKWEEKSF